jgi:phage terminase large subunit-like protein
MDMPAPQGGGARAFGALAQGGCEAGRGQSEWTRAVIQELKHDVEWLIGVTPEGGKIARANAVSPVAELENVYMPANLCTKSDPC